MIRGYIFSIDEGDATKRVAIGFGSGASELKAAVEGGGRRLPGDGTGAAENGYGEGSVLAEMKSQVPRWGWSA